MIRILLLVTTAITLLVGCRSMDSSTTPQVAYPTPPVPLSEFIINPVKGKYLLPQTATTDRWRSDRTIIVVSESDIHLVFLQKNGQANSDKWGLIEFKSKLPAEDIFQQLTPGTAESDVVRMIGLPTRESFDQYPIIGIKSKSTKYGIYSWFSVTSTSELIFMHVHTSFEKAKDGRWVINQLTWDKSGGRSLSNTAPN